MTWRVLFIHTYSQFARQRIRILSDDKLGFFFELFHVDCKSIVVDLLLVIVGAFEFLLFGVFDFPSAEAGEGAEKAPGAAGGGEGEVVGVGGGVERETRERGSGDGREEREGFGERRGAGGVENGHCLGWKVEGGKRGLSVGTWEGFEEAGLGDTGVVFKII